jgi:hypothetical protein
VPATPKVRAVAEIYLGGDQAFDGEQPQLIKASRFGVGERFALDVGECRAAPVSEGVAPVVDGCLPVSCAQCVAPGRLVAYEPAQCR